LGVGRERDRTADSQEEEYAPHHGARLHGAWPNGKAAQTGQRHSTSHSTSGPLPNVRHLE
jgi:hypothetical protein